MLYIVPIVSALVLIGIDQLTKYYALVALKPIGSTTVIEGIMDFTFVENRGVAFGMFAGQRWLILLLTFAITIGLAVYYYKLPRTKEYKLVHGCLVLVLAGALGNIIDRVLRGYVVDFFEFTFIQWPVFNMADIYVVIGMAVLAFLIMFVIKEPEKKDE